MPTVRHLKLLYGVASAVWLGFYAVRLFFLSPGDRNPNPMAAEHCFLLIGAVPALGFILLFKVLPWVGRALRRT
jgi:hypothetical protein